jgi:hypothetical protein
MLTFDTYNLYTLLTISGVDMLSELHKTLSNRLPTSSAVPSLSGSHIPVVPESIAATLDGKYPVILS